jgi:hypothetical protein
LLSGNDLDRPGVGTDEDDLLIDQPFGGSAADTRFAALL